MITGYQCCKLYRALKLHFTSDYDYIRYKGNIKYTISQYEKNKHKFVYERLSKKFNTELETKDFFISNFLINDNLWVQDLCSNQESFANYNDYLKRIQSLTYVFKNDILNIFEVENPQTQFKSISGEFPELLIKYLRNEICTETLIIMDDNLDFLQLWEKNIKDDYLWPNISRKLRKYKVFLNYDRLTYKNILIQSIKSIT